MRLVLLAFPFAFAPLLAACDSTDPFATGDAAVRPPDLVQPAGKFLFQWHLYDTSHSVHGYACDDPRQVIKTLAFDLTDAGVKRTTTVPCPAGAMFGENELADLPKPTSTTFDLVGRALDAAGVEKNRSMVYPGVGIDDGLNVNIYVLDPV